MLKAAGREGEAARLRHADTPSNTTGWMRDGRFFIPFSPGPARFKTLSAREVLDGTASPAAIAGKFVLVGSTATGLGDVVATPVSSDHQRMPGVVLNANILSGLLHGRLARELDHGQQKVLTVAITAVAAFLLVTTGFPAGILLFFASVTGILAFSAILLFGWQPWFPPAAAIAPLILGFPIWGAWSLLNEKRINRSLTVRMQHQALHHSATDLPNQYVLEERLRALDEDTGSQIVALVIVHIKWSGSAGGIVGRSAGDQLLRAIAHRLSEAVRADDLVAHLSGDDFGILVSHLADSESALRISDNLLNTLQEPLEILGSPVSLAPGMGLSLWPADSPDGNALLRDAYIAMFRARVEQSTRTCVYSDAIAQEIHARSQLEQALISAIELGQFEVYYQPQIASESGRIIGVEALLRWHNPELGLVYPGTFIPVAEHNGLIQAIGSWVLQTACAQVQQWHALGLGPLRPAVNLSPLQFADDNLVTEVRRALQQSGLDPECLELEITESALMRNLEDATSAMQLLKAEGVTLAIDDFGTGYSSLSNLRHFPLYCIKIDQSFTREIPSNADVSEITLTIMSMARQLKLDIIAEGVENESQAAFYKQHGCRELQGFFFSHPLPATELAILLENSGSGQAAPGDVPADIAAHTAD